MVKTAVLVSGGGTNLQALINARDAGTLSAARLSLVVASRENAYALTRARQAGIAALAVPRQAYSGNAEYDRALVAALQKHKIEFVVLAGFLSILGAEFIAAYPRRIINVHPSLIPAFCGQGFYGLRVHEAALAKGVKVTGATVHFVNEEPDGGEILLQKAVAVQPGDTPKTLQRRVMEEAEWQLLPQALENCCRQLINC